MISNIPWTAPAPPAPTWPTTGLLARWPLQSNLVDTVASYTFTRIAGSSDSFVAGFRVYSFARQYMCPTLFYPRSQVKIHSVHVKAF